MQKIIQERLEESINVKKLILKDRQLICLIEEIVNNIKEVLLKGNKVIFAGNGGSFADSIHLTAEFVSKFNFDRKPLSAIALGANNSIITSIDRAMYGSDQAASVSPMGFRQLVGAVRKIEKAMGDGNMTMNSKEIPIAKKLRSHIPFESHR